MYHLICRECDGKYIGETVRTLAEHLADHQRDAKMTPYTPFGQHCHDKHPNAVFDGSVFSRVQVTANECDCAGYRLPETVEIHQRQSDIDLNAGWTLI